MKKGYVYIMTNVLKTTLYVGVTSNIMHRVLQHKNKEYPDSFTTKYNCNLLVYFYEFDVMTDAITEEKRIKGGSRAKKIALINDQNPEWKDLSEDWYT